MFRAKKLVSVLAFAVLLSFLGTGVALAAEKIGVIEPQKILFQHPKFAATQQRVKSVLTAKQNEAKIAIEAEKDNNKKAQIYQTKKQEAAMEEQKLMAPLFKEIELSVRTVAKSKGITLVLDKAQVFFGGIDITNDVIQDLKKKNAGK
jgi:outer membrane protein